ncbi:MAG TPA: NAD(P)-dependent oxidoreductase [Patescibacteria group bacterium]|nr:NAD(P)-dependent oxidoreductase [Patescibacteria group bacterium]
MERQIVVHYEHPPDLESIRFLRARLLPQLCLTTAEDGPAPKDTNVLVAGRPTRALLEEIKSIRAVIVPWSGIPPETRQLVAGFSGITLHNLHHNAAPVAELALALLLAVAKIVVPLDRSMREHDWTARYLPSTAVLLEGKTALIVGYGAIGQRVASFCNHLGMDVLAIRRNLDSKNNADGVIIHPPEALHTLLPSTKALMICLPHTHETDGLIGQTELDLLPADAMLVNIGRGAVVDEAALYAALRDGRIHGAGLDVWYNYPTDEASRSNTPPANFPFHELDNVVMSPHRGGDSADTDRLRMMHLADLLNNVVEGKPMPNLVDLSAGY